MNYLHPGLIFRMYVSSKCTGHSLFTVVKSSFIMRVTLSRCSTVQEVQSTSMRLTDFSPGNVFAICNIQFTICFTSALVRSSGGVFLDNIYKVTFILRNVGHMEGSLLLEALLDPLTERQGWKFSGAREAWSDVGDSESVFIHRLHHDVVYLLCQLAYLVPISFSSNIKAIAVIEYSDSGYNGDFALMFRLGLQVFVLIYLQLRIQVTGNYCCQRFPN